MSWETFEIKNVVNSALKYTLSTDIFGHNTVNETNKSLLDANSQ